MDQMKYHHSIVSPHEGFANKESFEKNEKREVIYQ